MIQHTPRSTLFPYTTLFRSQHERTVYVVFDLATEDDGSHCFWGSSLTVEASTPSCHQEQCEPSSSVRSEEHTSELQSLRHIVCRLLLEKKNIIIKPKKTTDK